MKHATDTALDALEPLLLRLRTFDGLIEKKRGIFYRGTVAFLHFHEDGAELFADVRTGSDWQRLPASSPRDQRTLIAAVRDELDARSGPPASRPRRR